MKFLRATGCLWEALRARGPASSPIAYPVPMSTPSGWMNSRQGYRAHLQDDPVLPSSPNSLGRPYSTNSCHSRVPTPLCSGKCVWFEAGLKPPYLWAVHLSCRPGRRGQLGPVFHIQPTYTRLLWGTGRGTQVCLLQLHIEKLIYKASREGSSQNSWQAQHKLTASQANWISEQKNSR